VAALLPETLGRYIPAALGLNDVLLLAFAACALLQISGPTLRVLAADPTHLPASERGCKQLGGGAAAWQALQLGAFLALGYVAMLEPITQSHSVLHVRLVYAAYGIAYALEVPAPVSVPSALSSSSASSSSSSFSSSSSSSSCSC
jgi:hypothetical protein